MAGDMFEQMEEKKHSLQQEADLELEAKEEEKSREMKLTAKPFVKKTF